MSHEIHGRSLIIILSLVKHGSEDGVLNALGAVAHALFLGQFFLTYLGECLSLTRDLLLLGGSCLMFLQWAGCLVKIDTCISIAVSSLSAQKDGLSISLVINFHVNFVSNTNTEGTVKAVVFVVVIGAAATSVHPGVGTVLVFDSEPVGEGIESV